MSDGSSSADYLSTSSGAPRVGANRTRAGALIVATTAAAFGLVYWLTLTPVRIVDGAKVVQISTHQRTVEGVLREAGVTLRPEDSVTPGLNEAVAGTVSVRRAHAVRLQVDDAPPKELRTQAQSAAELLRTLGYQTTAFDRVTVNGDQADTLPAPTLEPGQPTVLELRRAIDVSVVEKGRSPVQSRSTARTVGEALMQNGYLVYLADRVNPPLSERLQPGQTISIERAKQVDVVVDGRRVRTRTHRERVGDVLTELNIILYDQDFTSPGLGAAVTDRMQVQVVRVRREIEIQQTPIPFETQTLPDANVELDVFITAQEGAPGVRERRTLVSYENGAEVKRELVADFVAREVQPKIYKYGTKVVVRALDTPDGPVNYWRVIRMDATTYSASTAGVSRFAKNFGITRCGIPMRKGIVAVDTNFIPLRTNVYVPGYGPGYACDTGGAIRGRRIDLGFDDDNLQLYRRTLDVYLLTPVPAKIRYVLD